MSPTPTPPSSRVRPGAWAVAVVSILGALVVLLARRPNSPPPPEQAGVEASAPIASTLAPVSPRRSAAPVAPPGTDVDESPAPSQSDPARGGEAEPPAESGPSLTTLLVALPPATPAARALVEGLARLDPAKSSFTPEEAATWRERARELLGQGAAGAAAIREFLQQNVDHPFPEAVARSLGADSAREALFSLLGQMGTREAAAVALGALQTTADPREIGLLARELSTLAPGEFEADAVQAARQSLELARAGSLPGRDVGPAFEVLQKYGDATVSADLESASRQWKYYSAIALAGLPEGGGVPTLARMALGDGPGAGTGRDPALRMLASLAGSNEDARTALLDAARTDRIPQLTWHGMAPLLAGDRVSVIGTVYEPISKGSGLSTTHIASGNQNFATFLPPGGLTPDEVARQTALIDSLAGATSNPQAQEALKRARELLARRVRTPVATGP